jgi:hypothetical protein
MIISEARMTFDTNLYKTLLEVIDPESKSHRENSGNLKHKEGVGADVVVVDFMEIVYNIIHSRKEQEANFRSWCNTVAAQLTRIAARERSTLKRFVVVIDKRTPKIKIPAQIKREREQKENEKDYCKPITGKCKWVKGVMNVSDTGANNFVPSHIERKTETGEIECISSFTFGSLRSTKSVFKDFIEDLFESMAGLITSVPVDFDYLSNTHGDTVLTIFPNGTSRRASEFDKRVNNFDEADLALIHWARLFNAAGYSVAIESRDGDVFVLLYMLCNVLYDSGEAKEPKHRIYWTSEFRGIAFDMYPTTALLALSCWRPLNMIIVSHLIKSDYIEKKFACLDGIGLASIHSVICTKRESQLVECLNDADKMRELIEKIIEEKFGKKSSKTEEKKKYLKGKKTDIEKGITQWQLVQKKLKEIVNYYTTCLT